MSTVQIELPPKLIPLFTGTAMYRISYGGRGSAKTRSFAKMAAVWGIRCSQAKQSGVIVCAREYCNSLDDSSMAEVKEAIISEPWLNDRYEIGERFIRTKDRRIDFAFIGMRHNLDSIKSKSRIRLLWVDEAEPVIDTAWDKADKTVREEGSEVWVTWNPERKKSATNQRFRENPPENSKIVEMNWRDNPWFEKGTLPAKRLEDLSKRPESYDHIWEGAYITAQVGAYFSKQLLAARMQHRVCRLSLDPLMTVKAFCDIGGTSAKSDAFVMWITQFIGKEIRFLDYYEVVGQELSDHVYWLRENGYGRAHIYLPHDGVKHDNVYKVTYESEFKRAGFNVTVIPNQGAGAAMRRIKATQTAFPFMWFDEVKCEAGLEALGWYHEKKDEVRDIGLGPDHDWSSHCCDAAGMTAIVYDLESKSENPKLRGRSGYSVQDDVVGY